MRTFPAPAPAQDASAEELTDYARRVRAWRDQTIRDLVEQSKIPEFPRRAAGFFRWILTDSWPDKDIEWVRRSPYNIRPFPLEPGNRTAAEDVQALLSWYATLGDLLGDIWDVMDEPLLDVRECSWVGKWLWPTSEEKLCLSCLRPFSPEETPSAHECAGLKDVRAKWPELPW